MARRGRCAARRAGGAAPSLSLFHGRRPRPCARRAAISAWSASAPRGGGSMRSASTMAPSRAVSRTRTAPLAGSNECLGDARRRDRRRRPGAPPRRWRRRRRCARSAPCPAGRRRRGRPRRPAGRRRRALAPRPLASTKRPRSPRALATRSGQAWTSSTPAVELALRAAVAALRRPAAPAARQAGARRWRAATARSGIATAGRSRSAPSPPSPRSVISTASSAAARASPSRAASATMCASRTGRARPRMARPASVSRPLGVDRAELDQQRARLGQRRRWRRVEEGERGRIGDAEGGAVEHQAGEVGLEDLGRREGRQRRGLLGPPQPDRNAGLGAARTSRPLNGGSAGHAHGLQPRQPGGGFVSRQPRQSCSRPRRAPRRW